MNRAVEIKTVKLWKLTKVLAKSLHSQRRLH